MAKYLVALIWIASIAAIFGIAILADKMSPALAIGIAGSGPDGGSRRRLRASGGRSPLRTVAGESARLIAIAAVGTATVFGVMWALGIPVVHHGLAIDRPIFTWVSAHQVHVMRAAMTRLTRIGDAWTTWGAAAAAAVCLTVTWRAKRWLPPVALAFAIVIDHYATLALRHTLHRIGPPTSPLGTYPSGGADRCMLIYGLIAYLLWHEFSGQRRAAIWTGATVVAVGFDEAYSRVYLSLHWFTDALSGLLYGTALLIVFIIAVRTVAGPPNPRHATADLSADAGAAVAARGDTPGPPALLGPAVRADVPVEGGRRA